MANPEEDDHLMSGDEDRESFDDNYNPRSKPTEFKQRKWGVILIYTCIGFFAILLLAAIFASLLSSTFTPSHGSSCLDLHEGYTCSRWSSRNWGQYSPYYLVPSPIDPTTPPPKCHLTSAHLLSRHGARDPTHDKSKSYAGLIARLQSEIPTSSLSGAYAFLASYNYSLGSDQLTSLGRQQLLDSGHEFFSRYSTLTSQSDDEVLFIRASGQRRVVESAEKFAQGFNNALVPSSSLSRRANDTYPYPILTIPEEEGQNNTLSHGQCPAFEHGQNGKSSQLTFLSTWLPNIHRRLVANLHISSLTEPETIYLMDLCPFETVASPTGTISPFCNLFNRAEWIKYDYYQTLGKYYGYGTGSVLGPTQGVGWVNELIARLTGQAVDDHTNTNRTLDSDAATFPLGRKLYADFSHDNDMMSIFAAMGLYESTPVLDTGRVMWEEEMEGYGVGRMVPFAGRMVVEGMDCDGRGKMVRVVMNGRVLPLDMCGGDEDGKCTLSAFVDSLGFARKGGKWDQCFPN